jgi:hypothetical protein
VPALWVPAAVWKLKRVDARLRRYTGPCPPKLASHRVCCLRTTRVCTPPVRLPVQLERAQPAWRGQPTDARAVLRVSSRRSAKCARRACTVAATSERASKRRWRRRAASTGSAAHAQAVRRRGLRADARARAGAWRADADVRPSPAER